MYILSTGAENNSLARIFGDTQRPEANLLSIAHALSESPLWAEMPSSTFVVRQATRPMLGILGRFDAAGEARLEALRRQLKNVLPCVRYVSYAQAEADCERLRVKLIERFGRDDLCRFQFSAIPRGGLIVLGILAYTLGLAHTQLDPLHIPPPDIPLVVVDDCALTGAHFGRFLGRCQSRQVIFVHLYSHPDLREAIKARESRVIDCPSAQDLHDHAPERLGNEYPTWRERWLSRSKNSCYWVGQPDYICFAWNEPDMTFWNPVTQREESGWHVVPPELCLKNRSESSTNSISVQVQPEGKGPLKPSANVLFGELEGQIVVGNVETGQSFGLEDVAADFWRAIVEYGNLEDVVNVLLRDYDVDESTLCDDLKAFTADLLGRGLLEKKDDHNPNH